MAGLLLAVFFRMAAAIVASALAFTLFFAPGGPLWLRALRWILAALLGTIAALLVLIAIPAARQEGLEFVAAIATAAFIAGAAVETLLRPELRRLLGLEGAAKP